MIKVVFLGFGNVNSHLFQVFQKSPTIEIVQVYNRSKKESLSEIAPVPFTDDLKEIKEADIYIIGISDDAIEEFSDLLPFRDRLVVHTSGGVEMNKISGKNRRGVFYPLQTFSKQREPDFQKIPICLEADNEEDLLVLKNLAKEISESIFEINSEKRAKIHVAAVFVNNFVNFLYHIGSDLLKEDNLPFELLIPLIQETAEKIEDLSPEDAQTGPARRNDQKTIQKHLLSLKNENYKEVYTLMTDLIYQQHRKKS